MPGGDRTGPWGGGPMTGRGAGFCGGFGRPGYANGGWGFGRGFGRGWGRGPGFGYGRGFYPAAWGAAPEDEKGWLEREASVLRSQLDSISKRLEQLHGKDNE